MERSIGNQFLVGVKHPKSNRSVSEIIDERKQFVALGIEAPSIS